MVTGLPTFADVGVTVKALTVGAMELVATHERTVTFEPSRLDPSTKNFVMPLGPGTVSTTAVAASKDMDFARPVQEIFSCHYFRVYTNDDVLGVELCGSIKAHDRWLREKV